MTELRPARRMVLVLVALGLDLAFWGGATGLRDGGSVPAVVVITSAAIVALVLGLRRDRPVIAYGLAWLHTVAWGLVLPTYESFTLLLVALYDLARHRRLGGAVPFLLATALPWSLNTINGARGSGTDLLGGLAIAAVWCVMTSAVWLVARFGRQAEDAARSRERQLAAEAALARQDERLRLARELHDVAAHHVTAIVLQSAAVRGAAAIEQPLVARTLETIEDSASRAMRELRTLLGFLRTPEEAADLHADGNLDALLASVRACGVSVESRVVGESRRLDPIVDHVVYRVVQEALANVLRHGGAGCRASIEQRWLADRMTISVQNSISGTASATQNRDDSGYGLAGMRERLAPLGGELTAERTGDTFMLAASIPLVARSGGRLSPTGDKRGTSGAPRPEMSPVGEKRGWAALG